MAEHTEFAGLLALAPGEPLYTEGFAFQAINPYIIDRLLRVGATTHRHDAHPPLANPVAPPAVAITEEGHVPSGLNLHVGYTLVDEFGGETALSETIIISTGEGLLEPLDAPTLAVDHDAGTLLADSYAYAATVTDGLGGETALSPLAMAEIESGHPNSRITISGLQSLVEGSNGVGWRLYRSVGSGAWTRVAEGVADAVVDDGGLCADCGTPPDGPTDTSLAVNRVNVTLPVIAGVTVRLYISPDGSFESPCLIGDYTTADVDLDDLELLTGAPPAASTTVAGAALINPETDIANFTWRGPVANEAALPAVGNRIGDVRLVLADLSLWAWDGDSWQASGGGGGGGGLAPLQAGDELKWGLSAGSLRVADDITAEALFDDTFVGVDPGAWLGDRFTWSGAEGGVIGAATGTGEPRPVFEAPGDKFFDGDVFVEFDLLSAEWDRIGASVGSRDVIGVSDDYLFAVVDRAAAALQLIHFDHLTEVETVLADVPIPIPATGRGYAEIIVSEANVSVSGGTQATSSPDWDRAEFTYALSPALVEAMKGSGVAGNRGGLTARWTALGAFRFTYAYIYKNTVKRQLRAKLATSRALPKDLLLADSEQGWLITPPRTTREATAAGVAATGSADLNIQLGKSYTLYQIQTNVPARVRLYANAAYRAADAARDAVTEPTGDHGLLMEITTEVGQLSFALAPAVVGYNLEDPVTAAAPLRVTNLDAAASDVTVTLVGVTTEN